MTQRNDGGPAFPVEAETAGHERLNGSALGMTLRDYFAAKAMQGMMTENFPVSPIDKLKIMLGMSGNKQTFSSHTMVRTAYEIADAMLAEREKQS